ncbi:hypothetical protein [Aurantimonas sp. Leaf443]|uniref:hypothetical protein n=1 Tax=Aurantimonas sp. Leaf443 TaxID=1736378 RepID=UPI0006FC7B3E|nr:hypothetical protein [Aurantimonas sp. Leaf443]KQT83123.1 hypothetical protein ASG48_14215 [Aurantimonas sp. Leaf443]
MAIDLGKLSQRRAALEARLAMATTALRDAQRRDDARRKIVVGGTLLTAIRDGAVPASVLDILRARMSERDRLLFTHTDTTPVSEVAERQS